MAAIDWEPWIKILQSETLWLGLGTAFIGSFAGARGGAYAAQRIADRGKLREVIRRDVVRTNAAIEQVYMHVTKFLNLKEQYVLDMIAEYNAIDKIVHEYEAGLANGLIPKGTPPPVLPAFNMFAMSKQEVRVERLESIIMDELTISGRPRALVNVLQQSALTLNALLDEREKLLNAIKVATAGGLLRRQHIAFMFGVPTNGGADLTFKTNVRGIGSTTDECIHFCWLLYNDLHVHGNRARERYRELFTDPVPEISELHFDEARAKGLFPDPAPFESWERSFIGRIASTRGQRLRKGGYWIRKVWRKAARSLRQSRRARILWWWSKRILLISAAALLAVMILREVARALLPLWQRLWG